MHNPDGLGLQHRPDPAVPPRRAYTQRERATLLQLTDEADHLVARLRLRAVRSSEYNPRLNRIAGKAFARLLRRIWLGMQPYSLRKG